MTALGELLTSIESALDELNEVEEEVQRLEKEWNRLLQAEAHDALLAPLTELDAVTPEWMAELERETQQQLRRSRDVTGPLYQQTVDAALGANMQIAPRLQALMDAYDRPRPAASKTGAPALVSTLVSKVTELYDALIPDPDHPLVEEGKQLIQLLLHWVGPRETWFRFESLPGSIIDNLAIAMDELGWGTNLPAPLVTPDTPYAAGSDLDQKSKKPLWATPQRHIIMALHRALDVSAKSMMLMTQRRSTPVNAMWDIHERYPDLEWQSPVPVEKWLALINVDALITPNTPVGHAETDPNIPLNKTLMTWDVRAANEAWRSSMCPGRLGSASNSLACPAYVMYFDAMYRNSAADPQLGFWDAASHAPIRENMMAYVSAHPPR